MHRHVRFVLIFMAAVLPHLAVWNGGFSFDDIEFVEANASLRSIEAALGSFDDPFPPHRPELARYRPITNLSYAIQYAFWEANPRGYHRVNILLYLAVVLLVYRLGCRYLASKTSATWLALLFALHPVHCEVVDSVAGQSELISLLFVLLSLLAFHRFVAFAPTAPGEASASQTSAGKRARAGLTAALCYAAALLSKESAIVLPGLFLAHLLIYHQRPPTKDTKEPGLRRFAALLQALPYFALVPVYMLLRWKVLGRMRPDTSILGESDLTTQLWTVGRVFFEYLRLLIFPHPLQVDYYYQSSVGIQTHASIYGLLGWAALGLLLGWLLYELLRVAVTESLAAEPLRAAALFGALVFFAFLFPVSHIVPFRALMAERFLFAPSLGAFLFAVAGIGSLRISFDTPPLLRRVAAVLLAALALLSGLRAADWRSEVTLWTSLATRIDDDPRIYANLGRGFIREGDLARAEQALSESLRLDPTHITALNNLAALRLEAGDFDLARSMFHRVIELQPESQVAWTNLGVIETRLLRHADAWRFYERALAADPNHEPARRGLVGAKEMVAKAEKALTSYAEFDRDSMPIAELRNYVLANLVVGNFEKATQSYALLKLRAPENEVVQIPQLEHQLAARTRNK